MKKILSLILALTMVSSSSFAATTSLSAQADHLQMIHKIFNQFQYKMTVESAGNDAISQAKAVETFKEQLAGLQKQGVSTAEIMDYMRSSTLDASARQDFDRLMSNLPSQIAPEDASNMAMQLMAGHYQSGAHYSGGAIVAGVSITLLIVGAVAFVIAWNNGDFNSNNNNNNCNGSVFCF